MLIPLTDSLKVLFQQAKKICHGTGATTQSSKMKRNYINFAESLTHLSGTSVHRIPVVTNAHHGCRHGEVTD